MGRIDRGIERALVLNHRLYARTLGWALRHRGFMLLVMLATVVVTVQLYRTIPKGFLPIQDTGILMGSTIASPDISFKAMEERQRAVVDVLFSDPAVATVGSQVGVASGWNSLNRGQLQVSLKPLDQRGVSSEAVIARLRPKLADLGGIQTFLFSAQDLRGGGRSGGSQFQFVVISPDLAALRHWGQLLEDRLKATPGVTDVTSDQDRAGPQENVVIDRTAAARLGVKATDIDNALNNAFAQRQVSTIYTQRNQYKVVLETDPALQTTPSMLDRIYVASSNGHRCPYRRWRISSAGKRLLPSAIRASSRPPRSASTWRRGWPWATPRRRCSRPPPTCACRPTSARNLPAMRNGCRTPRGPSRC